MDLVDISIRLFVVFLLVGLNGFFVAAEFALVSSRPTRIDQIVDRKSLRGRVIARAMFDPNRFISSAQVGITMASLGLGWVGEPALAALIEPQFKSYLPDNVAFISSHGAAVIIAFTLITYLHLVLGEQVPKMMSIQRAERTLMYTAQLTDFVGALLRPLIAVVYWSTELILRVFGLRYQSETHMVYTIEEIEMLVEASERGGHLEPEEKALLERVFEFSHLTAHQVMVPRTEIDAISAFATASELLDTFESTGRSRLLVYTDSIDNIDGVIHVKEVVAILRSADNERFNLDTLVRPVIKVPESVNVDDLLETLRAQRTHMAVVIEEHGGTAGLVTLEDVVSTLVGQVKDEFERSELDIAIYSDGSASIDGLVLIDEFNRRFNAELDSAGVDTLGGLVFGAIGRKPELGDEVAVDGFLFRVVALDGLRIARVQALPIHSESATDGE